jgi:hypothetical protein
VVAAHGVEDVTFAVQAALAGKGELVEADVVAGHVVAEQLAGVHVHRGQALTRPHGLDGLAQAVAHDHHASAGGQHPVQKRVEAGAQPRRGNGQSEELVPRQPQQPDLATKGLAGADLTALHGLFARAPRVADGVLQHDFVAVVHGDGAVVVEDHEQALQGTLLSMVPLCGRSALPGDPGDSNLSGRMSRPAELEW